jgi:hypothetical protein
MNETESHNKWEQTVWALAEAYPFPPTPDIAGGVRRRLEAERWPRRRVARPAWQRPALALAVLLLLLALALSVPAVRAAVREWLRIGAVRIFITEPSPVTVAAPAALLYQASPSLGEPLTLAEAQAAASFALRLPSVAPADRPPDQVYLQSAPDVEAAISVWLDPEQPAEPLLSLYQISGETFATKFAYEVASAETTVGGDPAYWVEGPHPLLLDGRERWPLVSGDVLVWSDGPFTYRLESSLSLEEMVQVAESLR